MTTYSTTFVLDDGYKLYTRPISTFSRCFTKSYVEYVSGIRYQEDSLFFFFFAFILGTMKGLRTSCLGLIAGTLLLSDILADLSGKRLEDTAIKSLTNFYSARLVSADPFC